MIIGSGIGLYYYLRVMVTLYMATPGMLRHDTAENWEQRAGGLMVLCVAGLVLLVGMYPQPVLEWIRLAKPLFLH